MPLFDFLFSADRAGVDVIDGAERRDARVRAGVAFGGDYGLRGGDFKIIAASGGKVFSADAGVISRVAWLGASGVLGIDQRVGVCVRAAGFLRFATGAVAVHIIMLKSGNGDGAFFNFIRAGLVKEILAALADIVMDISGRCAGGRFCLDFLEKFVLRCAGGGISVLLAVSYTHLTLPTIGG